MIYDRPLRDIDLVSGREEYGTYQIRTGVVLVLVDRQDDSFTGKKYVNRSNVIRDKSLFICPHFVRMHHFFVNNIIAVPARVPGTWYTVFAKNTEQSAERQLSFCSAAPLTILKDFYWLIDRQSIEAVGAKRGDQVRKLMELFCQGLFSFLKIKYSVSSIDPTYFVMCSMD